MTTDIAAYFIDLQQFADDTEDTVKAPTIERYEDRIRRDQHWLAYYRDRLATATRESDRASARTSIAALEAITATHQAKLEELRLEQAA
jgi:hypothetical protein